MSTKVKIKITDQNSLREQLEAIYQKAGQLQICQYALQLATHILEITHFPDTQHDVIQEGYAINEAFQRGEVRMHDVRLVGFKIHQLAKTYQNPIFQTTLRVVGHAVSSAHMKEHAIVASDYAIKVINQLYPDNLPAIIAERHWQIETLQTILHSS